MGKISTIVCLLKFIIWTNFMLVRIECLIISGPCCFMVTISVNKTLGVFIISDSFKRIYHPPSAQSRSDKQLVMFDSFEKMSGYTYFGVIDFDEFLIPSKNRTLKALLVSFKENVYPRFYEIRIQTITIWHHETCQMMTNADFSIPSNE